jgi:hypothetical protein
MVNRITCSPYVALPGFLFNIFFNRDIFDRVTDFGRLSEEKIRVSQSRTIGMGI